MHREYLEFPSGAYRLAASVGLPDGLTPIPGGESSGRKVPGVIFCHGFTGHRIEARRVYARLAAMLAGRGIGSFRFDHRGCGESDGDFSEFTPKGMLEDLDAALDQLLALPWLDSERTAVVGYSLGGTSASYLLSRRPRFVTAVYWAPVAKPEIIRDRLSQFPGFEGYEERGFFDYAGFRVSRDYLDYIGETMKPLEWASHFPGSILFCHGMDDEIVRPEQTELFLTVRKNAEDRSILIPEADHGFGSAANIDHLLGISADWLAGKLL